MLSTITYTPGFVNRPSETFVALWNGLKWERRGATPRREYYCNDAGVPYTYGTGEFARTYAPAVWTDAIMTVRASVEGALATKFEVCFLNGYENAREHLGWHSDNSQEMDDNRPIAIVTLGAAREIWFCPIEDKSDVTKVILESGSLCVMAAGMQDTHMHRIPKAGYDCGPRISLTFRGYAPV